MTNIRQGNLRIIEGILEIYTRLTPDRQEKKQITTAYDYASEALLPESQRHRFYTDLEDNHNLKFMLHIIGEEYINQLENT